MSAFRNYGIIAAFALMAPVCANAAMIGSSVNVDFYYPSLSSLYCTNGTATVGAGVEYGSSCSGFGGVSIDITNTQIVVDTGGIGWSGGSFNGFIMSILSGPIITSFGYDSGSMGVSGTSFTGTSVSLNFEGQDGGRAVFNIGTGPAQVPLPASALFLGPLLALLGFMGWRKRKAIA